MNKYIYTKKNNKTKIIWFSDCKECFQVKVRVWLGLANQRLSKGGGGGWWEKD